MLRAFAGISDSKEYRQNRAFQSPTREFFPQDELELIWWKELGLAFRGLLYRFVKRAALSFVVFVAVTGGFLATVGHADVAELSSRDVQCSACILACEDSGKCTFSV